MSKKPLSKNSAGGSKGLAASLLEKEKTSGGSHVCEALGLCSFSVKSEEQSGSFSRASLGG